MRRAVPAIAVLAICCNRAPAGSTQGSTDTVQKVPDSTTATAGTTATETGTGAPAVSSTTGTGNAAGSGGTGTSGTQPVTTTTR